MAHPWLRWFAVCCCLAQAACAPGRAAIIQTGSAASQDDFKAIAEAAATARTDGRIDDAIREYTRAVALQPSWQEGWWYLGTIQYDRDRYADAIPPLQKLVQLAPDLGAAWSFLGLSQFETRDYEQSLASLEKAQSLGSSDDPELTRVSAYHLALLLNRNGQFPQASALLLSAFGRQSSPAPTKIALGLALLHVPLLPGEVDPSRDALLEAVGNSAQPNSNESVDDLAALVRNNPGIPYLHHAYAQALASRGRTREAQQQQKLEDRAQPASAETIARLYRIGAAPGSSNEAPGDWAKNMQDYSAGRYPETIAALKAWVERRPGDGTAWAVMGLSEYALKDYDNALIHLQRGVELGLGGSVESVALANHRLAILLIRKGEFDRATGLLSPLTGPDPLANEIQFSLGMALLRISALPEDVPASQQDLVQRAGQIVQLLLAGKYDAAFPIFQALLKQYPSAPFLHYAYGTALESISQYDEAKTQMRAELQISPHSALPWIRLASIALREHLAADALPSAQAAVKLAPGSADAHYVLGRACTELGETKNAIGELQKANSLTPGSPEIHFALARAYTRANLPGKAAEERSIFTRLNTMADRQRDPGSPQAASSSILNTGTPASTPQ